jgi:hypothetical protein
MIANIDVEISVFHEERLLELSRADEGRLMEICSLFK